MKKLFRKLFPNKEMRAYCKMHRRHRRELIKHAKATYEWGWDWLHDSVIMQIRHMYEYYIADNNVCQTDDRRFMIIEQLKRVLDLNEAIDQIQYDDHWWERAEELENREQKLYEELYSSIGRDLRWWWD